MTDHVQLWTTTDSAELAQQIATALVEQQLAACVQIVPQVRSVYRWQGKIEFTEECLCLVKTGRTLVGEVEALVRKLHTYDCPEIVVVAIESTSDDYLQWLAEQLK